MKFTLKLPKHLSFILLTLLFAMTCSLGFSQIGDSIVNSPVISTGFHIPSWVWTALGTILAILTFAQWLLKRIPTPFSVRISGIIGKVLDVLTIFQKDRKDTGGTFK